MPACTSSSRPWSAPSYGSPSPGAASFVSPGDRVAKGQVIGIVEAMKLMNEIESDAAGEVVKCLVSNGQPIEYRAAAVFHPAGVVEVIPLTNPLKGSFNVS